MPEMTKIHDRIWRDMFPYQRRTDRKDGSFRIKCACHSDCKKALVIYPGEAGKVSDTLEIEGVVGSVDQWRQTFGPILMMEPFRTEPLYEFELDATRTYVTLAKAARMADTSFAKVAKITGSVLDPDMKVRPINDEEVAEYKRMAEELADKR